MARLIDADELLKHKTDHEMISTHLVYNAPTVDAKPVIHARWIERDDGWGGVYYDCSVCNESWTTIEGTPFDNGMKYCPHCGAKMEQQGENT